MKDCTETRQERDDRAVIDVVSELHLAGGLLNCAWHAADVEEPDPQTTEGIRQTIEVAAEKVGQVLDRLERMEIRARVRLPA